MRRHDKIDDECTRHDASRNKFSLCAETNFAMCICVNVLTIYFNNTRGFTEGVFLVQHQTLQALDQTYDHDTDETINEEK